MSIKQFLSRIDRVIFNKALRRFYFLYFAKKTLDINRTFLIMDLTFITKKMTIHC